jgi:hypothetical protein
MAKYDRYLVVRIPLKDSDPYDVIGEIDNFPTNYQLGLLIDDRFEDVILSVETGDRVH